MHPMNAQAVEKLGLRFGDDVDARPPADPDQAPADPAHQVDVSRGTTCSPAEFRALEAATRQEFLVKLDRWRTSKKRR